MFLKTIDEVASVKTANDILVNVARATIGIKE
jgi:hypothetical protein